jgi:hypothetical protein
MMTYIQYVKHVGGLKMSQYASWIIFGGIRLIHILQNQWEHELTNVASTYIGSLIQTRIWCHATNTYGQKFPQRWEIFQHVCT